MRYVIKKAIPAILAAVMLAETASALSIDKIETKNELVTVTVSDESPETYITFRTVKNDATESELGKTAALLQERTDIEGKTEKKTKKYLLTSAENRKMQHCQR